MGPQLRAFAEDDPITRRQDVRAIVEEHNARERRRRQVADAIVGVVVALAGAGAVVAVELLLTK
jgi:beta-lactamase regulating signal transducer with metallopeptidase domain